MFDKKDATAGTGLFARTSQQPLPENQDIKDKDLKEQVKYLLELPDDQYSDQKLTSKMRQYISEIEKEYTTVINDYKTHIAPSYWEFTPTHYNVS